MDVFSTNEVIDMGMFIHGHDDADDRTNYEPGDWDEDFLAERAISRLESGEISLDDLSFYENSILNRYFKNSGEDWRKRFEQD
jgi:hypothetical protein